MGNTFNVTIKNNADLDAALGAKLGKAVRGLRNDSQQRLPRRVEFVREKPAFYLNDGSILRAYAIDLVSGTVLGSVSCGTGSGEFRADVALQNSTGQTAPDNHALMFVESFWNGRNHSWALTIVTHNIPQQLVG